MKVSIDKTWTALDFATLFEAIDRFYLFFALVRVADRILISESAGDTELVAWKDDVFRSFTSLQDFHSSIPREDDLFVKKLTFASPGGIDFLGVAALVGHLKEVLLRLLELNATRRERQAKAALIEIEVEMARLKAVKEHLTILKELGFTNAERQKLLLELSPCAQSLLVLMRREMITKVE